MESGSRGQRGGGMRRDEQKAEEREREKRMRSRKGWGNERRKAAGKKEGKQAGS